MSDQKKYYITTAISYPNGAPHIGHAYEIIATDALARFQKMDGKDVFFLTGTDVHGKKMKQSADAANMDISEFAAKNSDKFRAMAEMLGCSHNDFIRTNQKRHHLASQEIWRRMQQNGDIYKGHYSGWYSVVDEAYYQENETQLIDGQRCGPSGTKVEWVAEESYFFRLSAYQQPLLDYYEANPDFIGPKERRNEVMAFVRSGLSDLSISRVNFGWGIEVPDDPAHSMYVWVDALTNYITGVGFPDDTDQKWYYWPADLHVIGKDIIRFHAVYWPAFLMSAKIALPARIYAHGHLLNSGEKMSKSLGNIVDPEELCQNFGRDGLRYFLLREVPFGQDGNYDHQAIIRRINADLANDLGNFAQRSLSMIQKNCQGILPRPGLFSQADEEILAKLDDVLTVCREHMARQAIHSVLAEIWSAVGAANRYFASQAPWTLRVSDPERMGTILYLAAEILRQIALLALPVMPDSCNRLLDLLAQESKARSFAALGRHGRIAAGTALPPPIVIFPRCEIPEDL